MKKPARPRADRKTNPKAADLARFNEDGAGRS